MVDLLGIRCYHCPRVIPTVGCLWSFDHFIRRDLGNNKRMTCVQWIQKLCTPFVKIFIFCQNKFCECLPNKCFWKPKWGEDQLVCNLEVIVHCRKRNQNKCPTHICGILMNSFKFTLKAVPIISFTSILRFEKITTYSSIFPMVEGLSILQPVYGRMWISLCWTFELNESTSGFCIQQTIRHSPAPVWRTF